LAEGRAQFVKRFCPACEQYKATKTVRKTETYNVRGCRITVPVTVQACVKCGERIGTDKEDEAVLSAVYDECHRRQRQGGTA